MSPGRRQHVGMGSFYNHFATKEELFEAALTDALDDLGTLLDSFTGSISDPAEAFAANYRLSGWLFRYRPQEAALLLAHGGSLIMSNRGLSPGRSATSPPPSTKAGLRSTIPNSVLPSREVRSSA